MGFYGPNYHIESIEMLLFEEEEVSPGQLCPNVRVLCKSESFTLI